MQRLHHGLCLAQTSRWFYWRQLYLSRFDTLLRYSWMISCFRVLRDLNNIFAFTGVWPFRIGWKPRGDLSQARSGVLDGTGMKSFGLVMSEVCHVQMTCHMLSYPMSTMSSSCIQLHFVVWWLKFGLSSMHVKITSGPTSGRRGMSTPCLGALFYRTGDSVGASATAGRLWT